MRGVIVLMTAAACVARAPERLPIPIVARGEVIAPRVPAYAGVVRTGACAIRFEPASADEQRERIAAYRARLPRGATVALTELGDRASKVAMEIAQPQGPRRKEAKRAARAADVFVHDTAELWGLPPSTSRAPWQGEIARHVYAFEYPGVPTLWEHGWYQPARLVVRIDLRRGRLDAGVIGAPLPDATVCDKPAIDATRASTAALAYVISLPRPVTTAEDLGPPMPWLLVDGSSARYVAAVPYGRGLGEMLATNPSEAHMTVQGFVLVNPDDDHVLGVEPAPYDGPVDAWYSASGDAEEVFGAAPGQDDDD